MILLSRSQQSLGQVSEQAYSINSKKGDGIYRVWTQGIVVEGDIWIVSGKYNGCLTRIPYATLIATIMCVLGVVVFCSTMYRGATLAFLMFDNVFKMRLFWYVPFTFTFFIHVIFYWMNLCKFFKNRVN